MVDLKDDFVDNVCRHFAMIFHVDSSSNTTLVVTTALGGPILASNVNSSTRLKNSNSSNLKELDPLIFLDALVDVLAHEIGSMQELLLKL